jgi:DNA modification methylase
MMLLPERSVTTLDTVHCMDALTLLRALPDNYVNCIVTSPPYYSLRDYQVAGQIGLEDTMQAYIVRLVAVFREARRVLRDDGVAFVNMGDGYAGGGRGGNPDDSPFRKQATNRGSLVSPSGLSGLKPKDLMGVPWRLAFALQDDGYYLRQDIIWHKPNPMPESVTDRCTKAHEYVFLLSKNEHYWYDADAIREPNTQGSIDRFGITEDGSTRKWNTSDNKRDNREDGTKSNQGFRDHVPSGRNKRSVWTVTTEATPFAHFATFPQALITPMIQAGCPAQVCSVCGAPYERVTDINYMPSVKTRGKSGVGTFLESGAGNKRGGWNDYPSLDKNIHTLGFRPTCDHTDAPTRPGIVLDMFGGSGTTGLVAMRLGRHYIMGDLSPEYVTIARQRLATADPYQDTPISETGETQLSLFEVTP